MKRISIILLSLIAFNTNAQTYIYDFSTGYDGWKGDFADYPVNDSVFYELEFQRSNLPAPLNTSEFGLKISGFNHSDDLFMFIKKKISGLLPNTTYQIMIDVSFASKAPTLACGVGGAPGESVKMKAGATIIEPIKVNTAGFYQMNINKGIQSNPGPDMDTIGHVGVSDTTTVFTIINRNNFLHQFTITTDESGEVWICIGTDSGFEATTTLYYKQITVTFSMGTTGVRLPIQQDFMIYPNPCQNYLTIKSKPQFFNKIYKMYDSIGRLVLTGSIKNEYEQINIESLTNGLYFFKIEGDYRYAYKIVKK
ncbi:MAG: T9SS type A sorting domain-containing protein [Bacteroidales bacterium]|jgi:hypothetical protein|nr:T9SS type A sorting domain-containing protein [Bacteroidales bacterium]